MSDVRDRFATNLPISNDGNRVEWVGFNVPNPMTEAEWEFLLALLAVVKPGFVWEQEIDPENEGTS